MPTIAVLDGGITIAIYYNDHDRPHFHAMQAEHEVLVEIAPLSGIRQTGQPLCGYGQWHSGDAPMVGSSGEGEILVGRVDIDETTTETAPSQQSAVEEVNSPRSRR